MTFDAGARTPASDLIALLAVVALLGALVVLRGRDASRSGTSPWWRALGWFSACVLASWATGVLPALLQGTPGRSDAAGFWLATAGCLVLVAVAYGLVWPIGTFTLDRPRDLTSYAFGAVWGLTEAQLLLAGYAVVEDAVVGLGGPTWAVVGLAFLLLSGIQGAWHALYWDLRVAPEHNVPEWNARKVVLCHVPNLLATLTHLAVYDAPRWFVLFQVLALALSAGAMRFPRPDRTGVRAAGLSPTA